MDNAQEESEQLCDGGNDDGRQQEQQQAKVGKKSGNHFISYDMNDD